MQMLPELVSFSLEMAVVFPPQGLSIEGVAEASVALTRDKRLGGKHES